MKTSIIEDQSEDTEATADESSPPVTVGPADVVSHLSLDDLKAAFSSGRRPDDCEDQPPNYYRCQRLIVRTDHHDAASEPVEQTVQLYEVGFLAAFQRLISMKQSSKSERMKKLEDLMWETLTHDWGVSKWDWRSRWYVVGFEPPETEG